MRAIVITAALLVYMFAFYGPKAAEPDIGASTRTSPLFEQIEYDAAHRILCLTFKSGHMYEYFDVPPSIYTKLLQTPAQGSFFNRHIRSNYAMRKVLREETKSPPSARPGGYEKQTLSTTFSEAFAGAEP